MTRPTPFRPLCAFARWSAALAACAVLAGAPAAGAAQERADSMRFPAPRAMLAVSLAAPTTGDPGPAVREGLAESPDPPPLSPPPPHRIRNAILVTTGASVVAMGVLLALPEDITGWSADDRSWEGIKDEWGDFKRHVTGPPVWDSDHWFFNYVGHPYVGMHTYLLERNYGVSPLRSFLYSTAASFAFEYLVEAWAEPPSAQDLLITSPVGSLVGELNYQFTRELRKGGLTLPEKLVVTVVNPLHVLQHGYR